MHGHFYPHQRYLQRSAVPQTASSTGVQRPSDVMQPGQLHFSSQHVPGLPNGQSFQTHSGQHLQQQRLHQIPHHSDLTQQQYAQLLQNQVLYNPAALQLQQQQQQQSSASLHHQDQRLIQHSPATQTDQTLRSLLASASEQSLRNSLQQRMQMASMSPISLRSTSMSSHLGQNMQQHMERLQQQQHPSKIVSSASRYPEDSIRSRLLSEQQRPRQEQLEATLPRSHPQSGLVTSNLQSLPPQNSGQPQVLNTGLFMQRHLPVSTPGRSPSGYHHAQNQNYLQNLIMSPPANTAGLISPHRNSFSPSIGHLPAAGPSRLPTTSTQMGRTELAALQEQHHQLAMQSRAVSQDLQSPRRTTPTGGSTGVTKTNVQVKRQTPSVNSSAAPVIISDSEDENYDYVAQKPKPTASVQPKESKEETKTSFTRVVIDDDIEITGFKEAEVMSHMRPDCPIHAFTRVDTVTTGAQGQNASKCGKCFCYVCDKPAKECTQWANTERPHCNAHARASCWKARRNVKKSPLMMKLPNDEITTEMAEAGEIALQYMIQIREYYITYRAGIPCDYQEVPCDCNCHRSRGQRDEPCMNCKVVHDVKKRFNYEPVREIALSIIHDIETKYSNRPLTALITLEAVLSELCSQRPADFNHTTRRQSNPDPRCQCNFPTIIEEHIEKEFISTLTRHEVPASFLKQLKNSVDEAIKPLQLKDIMKKFMSMRHWDDLLLRAVLSGSNITGARGREQLKETPEVIRHRIEKLDREKKYLHIIRYLRAVKVNHTSRSRDETDNQVYRWTLLYSSRQGFFKDVIHRLTEPIRTNNTQQPQISLSGLSVEFLIQLLDALSGKDATPDARLESFESRSGSQGPYAIVGKDADVLVFVILLVFHQNIPIEKLLPCYLWFARWVNRTSLSPSLNPENTRRWLEEGTRFIEMARQALMMGQSQVYLMHCSNRDPHVHLLIASICIMNAVVKKSDAFHSEHLQQIIEAYKNNEWALFLLVTQAPIMSFRDPHVLRWITKFCDSNNGVITQIQGSVIEDAIKFHPLDILADFISALVKPEWVRSIESIQRTVFRILSDYSLRLFNEMHKTEKSILTPRAKWLEEILLKPVEERKISPNLMHDMETIVFLKSIVKNCCFLNPVKRNIDLFRKITVPEEWPRQSDKLIRLLGEKFNMERISGTMEEFSSLIWLLWTSRRLDELCSYFTYFQDRHSCDLDKDKVTSSKLPDEVSTLLESTNTIEFESAKLRLMEGSRRLCVLETLSWLTCTECATRMTSHWTKVWESVSKTKIPDCLRALNSAMLEQFKTWLNKISLDAPEGYSRLMTCLRTFLCTLISTWQKCAIPLEEAKRIMINVSYTVADQRFQSDLIAMSVEIIHAEMDKLRPQRPTIPAPAPASSNHTMQQPRPNNLNQTQQSAQQEQPKNPTPSPKKTPPETPPPKPRNDAPQPIRKPSLEKPQQTPLQRETTRVPDTEKQQPVSTSAEPVKQNGPIKKSATSSTTSVMSPDSLFNRKNQISATRNSQNPDNSVKKTTTTPPKDEGAPFSPSNLARTKTCPNCNATISCSAFRCPQCNKATRTAQPVICPGCHQENVEVKNYSCKFCYRSLIDVIVGVNPVQTSNETKASTSEPKQETQKTKKKSVDKRKKKSKIDEPRTTTTVITTEELAEHLPPSPPKSKTEPQPKTSEQKISPLMVRISNKQNTTHTQQNMTLENSDSSSDDFVKEQQPPKKRRQMHNPLKKVPSLKLKRKLSSPPPPAAKTIGGSLTDSDTDLEEEAAPNIYLPKEGISQIKQTPKEQIKSPSHNFAEAVRKQGTFSPKKVIPEKKEGHLPRFQPPHQRGVPKPVVPQTNSLMKTPSVPKERPSSPQPPLPQNKNPPPVQNATAAKNRGVGHSRSMSKNQKKLLSRFHKLGKTVPKFSSAQKNPSIKPKDALKSSPAAVQKRNSIEPGPISSPGNHLGSPERFNNDANPQITSGSGLSFGLAKVRPRNVGHRTGGPPGKGKKMNLGRTPSDNPPSVPHNESLFPKPLNNKSVLNHIKKKKSKKADLMKRPNFTAKRALEKKLNAALRKRKPGPGRRTNYQRILKLERRLQKICRPSKLWKLPSTIKFPADVDLSLYMVVSLSPFPSDTLKKIQSLVPRYKLDKLFA